MKNKWIQYLFAYAMWFVFTVLGILFLVVSRNGVTGLLRAYFIQDDFQRRMQVNFIDRAYFFVMAFVLLILVLVVEEYFKRGINQGELTKRFAKVFGIEMLFLFVASLMTAYMIGFSPLILFVLGVELILGVLLFWFSLKKSGIVKSNTIENLSQ